MVPHRNFFTVLLTTIVGGSATSELAVDALDANKGHESGAYDVQRPRRHRSFMRAESGGSAVDDVTGDSLIEGSANVHDSTSVSSSPLVLYGIESCNVTKYTDVVDAIMETWASGLPRKQLVMVGGMHDDEAAGLTKVPMICPDIIGSLACKEAVLYYRAVERAKEMDAQWLMVMQEDKYVSPIEVDRMLKTYDPKIPQVIGPFGCGKKLSGYCDAVHDGGGMCGGPGYFVSRAALDVVLTSNQTVEDFVNETKAECPTCRDASDMSSSCMFWKRGVRMSAEEFTRDMFEAPGEDVAKLLNMTRGRRPLSLHLNIAKEKIPGYLRAMHSQKWVERSADS